MLRTFYVVSDRLSADLGAGRLIFVGYKALDPLGKSEIKYET